MQAVLAYVYEGNLQPDIEDSFDPRLNTRRAWYHAPWQDFGLNGREPIHGMTRERTSHPGELGPLQTHVWNNFAVGMYNAAGATALGRVWADHGAPRPDLSRMPEGTVAAKLLFTTAPESEVPYLKGAPTWNAYVFADANQGDPEPSAPKL